MRTRPTKSPSTSRTKKRKSTRRKKKVPTYHRNLPLGVMKEVLARLPVKSIMKFRRVSKSWCSLIDSQEFIQLHLQLQRAPSRKNRVLAHEYDKVDQGYVFTIRRGDTFRKMAQVGECKRKHVIEQSCNGLTLIQCPFGDRYKNRMLKLWNPCIRKALVLPRCPLRFRNPSGCASFFLGYAPRSHDFKVVGLVDGGDASAGVEFGIYSMNDHLWKLKTYPPELRAVCMAPERMVFSGGANYWLGCDHGGQDQLRVYKRTHVFFFDFETEMFECVLLPDAGKDSLACFLFPLGESIAYFTLSSEEIRIWAMERVGVNVRWRLWFSGQPSLDACDLLTSVTTSSPFSKIVFVHKYNIFMMVENFTNKEGERRERLMSYNYISQDIKRWGRNIQGKITIDNYVESLVLHKGFEGRMRTYSPWMMRQLSGLVP